MDKSVRVWDLASGRLAWSSLATGNVLGVALSPDARWVAAGTYDRRVLLWELAWR